MKKLFITGLSTMAFLLFLANPMFAGGGNDGPPQGPDPVALGPVPITVVTLAKPGDGVLFSNCQDEVYAAIDENDYSPLFLDMEYAPTWGRGYFMYTEVRSIGSDVEEYCSGTCQENVADNNWPTTTTAQECGVLMTESSSTNFGASIGLEIYDLVTPTNSKFSVKIQVCSGCMDCYNTNSGDDIIWWETTKNFDSQSDFLGSNTFNLTFQGAIDCTQTLDCTNWP